MKGRQHHGGSNPRRRKTTPAKARPRGASFIGTRPLKFQMMLRGQAVEVKVLPAIGTTTHINYEITISRGGKVLDWVPTRAELERIGRELAMQTERETSH
jgi:hypothetical protein